MDDRMLHAGCPVVNGAEKFGMNIWVRERPYVAQPGMLRRCGEAEGKKVDLTKQ